MVYAFKSNCYIDIFNFKPSPMCLEYGWLAKLELNKHLNKNSADLSPVNGLPVLFPP